MILLTRLKLKLEYSQNPICSVVTDLIQNEHYSFQYPETE